MPSTSPDGGQRDTLSSDETATVKEYIDNFTCMTNFTSGPAPEIQIKTLMLGTLNIGMSCLGTRIAADYWFDEADPFKYEGPGFQAKKLLHNKRLLLQVDVQRPSVHKTSEQCTYPHYKDARHCEALFLVYDVTSRASFEAAQHYHRNFLREREQARDDCLDCPCRSRGTSCPPRPPFQGWTLVLANKVDCDEGMWETTLEEGRQFANTIGPRTLFASMSVKTGEGCRAADVEEWLKRVLLRRTQNPPFSEDREAIIRDAPGYQAYCDSQRYWY